MSTIKFDGRCAKCGREPLAIGMPVSETQQFRDKEVVAAVVAMIQPFGVLIVLGNYFIKKEKMKLW